MATSKRTTSAGAGVPPRKPRGRTNGKGYQPEETRKALWASALKLFEERGYPETSVEDIVGEAGLTKGAFYHHFNSKQELLHAIHNAYVDSTLADLERVVEQYSEPEEQVRELIRVSVLGLEHFRSHIIVYLQDRRFLTGEWERAVTAKRDAIDHLMQSAIERGAKAGVFRKELNPRLMTFGIVGMLAWIIQWWRPNGPMSLDEIAEQYIGLVMGGLIQRPARR